MTIKDFFPMYDKLDPADREELERLASPRCVKAGTLLHNGGRDCMGLLLLQSGQLRAYITSDEGREITLYRLFERDICLFSASCVLNNIQFDMSIAAEKDTCFLIIPPMFFRKLMERSAEMANYVNQLMSSRFTEVMWLMEQVMWKSFDRRLAAFLLDEASIEGTDSLRMTHEQIAAHLGTAREVVTRMLKYFQAEGMVKLSRGAVELSDMKKLREMTE